VPYLLNFIYLLLIVFSLPWLLWQSARKGKYREGYATKFFGIVPRRTDSNKTCLWLHAVSVGEVNLLAPLLKMIEQERPEWECVISTTTTTGMALAKKKYPRQTVFYCPLDFSWAVKTAMRRVRPDALVLAELELWPNLIRAAKRHGAKVAVINGRLGDKSFRGYRRIRPLVARLLGQIDLVAAQDETYSERFRALGARPETVHMTGSMKYDGAQTDRDNPTTQRLAALAGFSSDDVVLLAGSTQEPEEAMVLETFRTLSPQWPKLRLVLVPRHPDRFDAVAKLLDASGIPWQRRTALNGDSDRLRDNLQIAKSPNLPSHPPGRRRRRTRRLVGNRPNRLRRRQHGQPGRTEHDRTGRLRRRRLVRSQHLELPRHRRRHPRPRCRGCRQRR
jgi:3-deoxy-D-manno-octulosonic-acid transferase